MTHEEAVAKHLRPEYFDGIVPHTNSSGKCLYNVLCFNNRDAQGIFFVTPKIESMIPQTYSINFIFKQMHPLELPGLDLASYFLSGVVRVTYGDKSFLSNGFDWVKL